MTRGTVEIVVNGRTVVVDEGTTVATALLNAGVPEFRTSVSGEARGPVCGMGICYECRVTIDGRSHQRACMTVVAHGMTVSAAGRDA
jgi:D-hydroxyproline dehydrogenase subunit gamma